MTKFRFSNVLHWKPSNPNAKSSSSDKGWVKNHQTTPSRCAFFLSATDAPCFIISCSAKWGTSKPNPDLRTSARYRSLRFLGAPCSMGTNHESFPSKENNCGRLLHFLHYAALHGLSSPAKMNVSRFQGSKAESAISKVELKQPSHTTPDPYHPFLC